MQSFNILVTAVGAVVGYGMAESLKNCKYPVHIVGTDIFSDAWGQHLCDDFVVATPAADEGYIDFLKSVMDSYKIDLVLFGIEQELLKVSRSRERLKGYIERMGICSEQLTELCNDKWATREWLFDNGLGEYAIDSAIEGDFDSLSARFGTPFLLKPRDSRAGKGIVAVDSREDFDYWKGKQGPSFMAQRIVGDAAHEYTVGAFGLGDGRMTDAIYMRRRLSQEGATAKAEVVCEPALERATRRLMEAARGEGPINMQFRLEGERVWLLEINPRVSASTSIRAKFGYNESEKSIEYYCMGKAPAPSEIRRGRAVRYIKDWVEFE